MFELVLVADVVLTQLEPGAAIGRDQPKRDGVVVLRHVRGAAERAPMRVGETLVRNHRDDLALVLERLALPFAADRDRAAFTPVGLDPGVEERLADQLGVRQTTPNRLGVGFDRDGAVRDELRGHDCSLPNSAAMVTYPATYKRGTPGCYFARISGVLWIGLVSG